MEQSRLCRSMKESELVFVKPQDGTQVSDAMSNAFKLCRRADAAIWMEPDEVEAISKASDQVFVFQSFVGNAFENLRRLNMKVIGPSCVLHCCESGESLQFSDPLHPIFNYSMKNLIICCTSMARAERADVHNKVKLMGGIVSRQLTSSVTHLIASEVSSQKYKAACNWGKHVMLPSWVLQCWEISQKEDIHADHPKYLKEFRCPIFNGLNITVSQLNGSQRKEIEKLVVKNGGIYDGSLTVDSTTHLILLTAAGDKYQVAKKKNIRCVNLQWIYDSLEKGFAMDEDLYGVTSNGGKITNKASTPKSDKNGLSMTLSDVSCISYCNNGPNVNETVSVRDVTLDHDSTKSACKPVQGNGVAARDALDNLDVSTLNSSRAFLDGCKIYVGEFTPKQLDKVRKLLNSGGATRFSQMNDSVTHVVAASSDDFKIPTQGDSGPFVVNAGWLVQSFKEGKPADEETFLFKNSDTSGSPTVGSGGGDGGSGGGNCESTVAYSRTELADAQVAACDDVDEELEESSMTSSDLFHGLVFEFYGFDRLTRQSLKMLTKRNGGLVKTRESEVADYAVGPAETSQGAPATKAVIVTNFWLQHCIEENVLFDVAAHPFFSPIEINLKAQPLAGCVISISQYSGAERDCLFHIAGLLGAKCQDFFLRKDNPEIDALANTHLIAMEADGSKYKGAVKWGRPAVNMNWLAQCAISNSKVDISPYIVGDAIGLIQARPVSKRILDLTKSSTPSRTLPQGTPGSAGRNDSDFRTPTTNLGTPAAASSAGTVERLTSDESLIQIRQRIRNGYNTPTMSAQRFKELMNQDASPMVNTSTDSPSLNTSGRDPKTDKLNIRNAMASLDSPEASAVQTKELPFEKLYEMQVKKALIFDIENNRSTVPGRKVEDILENDQEKNSPLLGTVIAVSNKLRHLQSELNRKAESLGAKVRWKYDKLCTHFVHQGKSTDPSRELRAAKSDGKFIVSPDWLRVCEETNSKADEQLYPYTQNFNRMLEIATETLKPRTPSQSTQNVSGAMSKNDHSKASSGSIKKPIYLDDSETSDQSIEKAKQQIDEILAATKMAKKKRNALGSMCKPLPPDIFIKPLPVLLSTEAKESEKDDLTPSITWDDPTSRKEREKLAFHLAKDSQQNSPGPDEIHNEDDHQESLQCAQQSVTVDSSESTDEEAEPKAMPIVMFSGSTEAIRQGTAAMFHKLGGRVLSTTDKSDCYTHLIVAKPSRSLKYLSSLASGKWILKQSYVEECARQQRFVKEEDHEWGNPNVSDADSTIDDGTKIATAAHTWRVKLQSMRMCLPKSLSNGIGAFQRWNVIIYSSPDRIDSFKTLLRGGGAKILDSKPPFTNSHGATHLFLELSRVESSNIDFESLSANDVLCLAPEYIGIYLTEPDAEEKVDMFIVAEAKSFLERKGKSKRKSDDDSDGVSKKSRS